MLVRQSVVRTDGYLAPLLSALVLEVESRMCLFSFYCDVASFVSGVTARARESIVPNCEREQWQLSQRNRRSSSVACAFALGGRVQSCGAPFVCAKPERCRTGRGVSLAAGISYFSGGKK